jgi:hypothetical protein
MMMFHNFLYDGKKDRRLRGFVRWWKHNSHDTFPEAKDTCDALIKVKHR